MKRFFVLLCVLSLSLFLANCAGTAPQIIEKPAMNLVRQIQSVDPPEEATNVPINLEIKISFRNANFELDKSSSELIRLIDPNRGLIHCRIRPDIGKFSLIPEEPLSKNTRYTVMIGKLHGRDGTEMQGIKVWFFNT